MSHEDHSEMEGMCEDPTAGPTWLISFLGVVFFVITILSITAVYYNAEEHEVEVKVIEQAPVLISELRAEQRAQLQAEPHWEVRDALEGKERAFVIPIDQAMQLVVKEHTE